MKEPVDHIIRPRLPWRDPSAPDLTECGYDSSKVKSITRSEFLARRKEMGEQRTAILTCMTCCDTSWRWPTWDEHPLKAIQREINWETGWKDNGGTLRDEMVAAAALIAENEDRFRGLIKEVQDRREWLKRAAPKKGDRVRW